MKLIIEIEESEESRYTCIDTVQLPGTTSIGNGEYVCKNGFNLRYYRRHREQLERFDNLSERIKKCVEEFYSDLNSPTTSNNDINRALSSGNSKTVVVEPSES